MDVYKILNELYAERARIEDAILALEILQEGQGKRRGRPPKWLVEARRRSGVPTGPNVPPSLAESKVR